jgi:hypothetical protein
LQSRIVSIANRIERVSHEIDATGLLALLALMLTSRFRSGPGPEPIGAAPTCWSVT